MINIRYYFSVQLLSISMFKRGVVEDLVCPEDDSFLLEVLLYLFSSSFFFLIKILQLSESL